MVQFNNELDEYDHYYHREVITSVNPLAPDHNDPHPHPPHLPTPVHALSGAAGAALANFITYPLDLIQTRLQVQKQVQVHRRKMKRERHRLQKGKQRDLSHSRSSTSSSSSSDSDSDDGVKVRRRGRRRTRGSVTEKHDSSDGGYMSAWELEYEQDETYDGVLDAAGKIFDKEGLGGLYHGVGWDTLATVGGNVWYFMVYHILRRQRLSILGPQHKHKPLPVAEEIGIGVMAAAVSRFFSSPLSTIVTRKQTSAMMYPHARPPSFFDIYRDIMRESGVSGFWAGYTASFWLTLNPSLTFLLYEKAKPYVKEKNHGKLDGVESFFLAALCKAVATTATYPLNVARARAQLDGAGKELDMDEMFHGPNEPNFERGIGTFNSRAKVRAAALKAQVQRKQKIVKTKGLIDMLVYIVRKEGISALYVGLGAELVKGFFTHGITMLAKEAVHRSILKLYYYVLDLYNNSEFAQNHGERLEPFKAKLHDKVTNYAARHEDEHQHQQQHRHQPQQHHHEQHTTHHHHQITDSHHHQDHFDDHHHQEQEIRFRSRAPAPAPANHHTSHDEFRHEERAWRETARSAPTFSSAPPPPPPPPPMHNSTPAWGAIDPRPAPEMAPMRSTFRSYAAPKTVSSVEKWMDRVETETSRAAQAGPASKPVIPAVFSSSSSSAAAAAAAAAARGPGAGAGAGGEIPRFIRDSSVASGNTGRTSLNTGRTSLKVHPPRSLGDRVREAGEWDPPRALDRDLPSGRRWGGDDDKW